MAKATYSKSPPQLIGGFALVVSTPTLKVYKAETTLVVAIRGTQPSDADDLKADASIPLNRLETTQRYQRDMTTLLGVMKTYPPPEYEYYGVGHSLGGAILDSFVRDGWIKNGVSYNPAIQPRDIGKTTANQRIYQSGDPLYAVMGQFASGAEVRPPKRKSVFDQLVSAIPVVGKAYDAYQNHRLENFEGGATHRESVLKTYGLEDEGHSLDDLATATGVSRDVLQEVYNRGIGAYKTNPQSVRMKGSFKKGVDAPMSQKLSKEHWAMSRVYSFLDGNPKHDTDLATGGGTSSPTTVESHLRAIGLSPVAYLREARRRAKEAGYDPKGLRFATDGTHKLTLVDSGTTTSFGAVGYKDHLMYQHLERLGKVSKGVAEAKRERFQSSHRAMKGAWRANPMSANRLALAILW